ncbi:MAG: CCDC90 family protein, partial [Phycisphaerales bacterium]|nr:CCDC90 family protein [Phycisphaerales bacterium]
MAANFETLEFVRTLTASGVPPAQAEAMARAYAKSLKSGIEANAAGKADVQALSGDIQQLGGELKSELKALRQDLQSELQSEVRSVLTFLLFGIA